MLLWLQRSAPLAAAQIAAETHSELHADAAADLLEVVVVVVLRQGLVRSVLQALPRAPMQDL